MLGIDPRAARATWTVFLLAALIGILFLARATLFILILAIFLAYLVQPGVRLLRRYAPRLSHTVAVVIVFVVVLGIVVAAGISIGSRISNEGVVLSEKLPAILADPSATDRIPLPQWMEPLRARIVETVRNQVTGGPDRGMSLARRIGVGVLHFAGNLVYLVVIPILSFMLVKDARRLYDAAMEWIPAGPRRSRWALILDGLNTLLAGYMRALLLLSLATFCAYSIVLTLLGAPYSLLLAAIAAPLEFIPVLGPATAVGIALLVSAVSGYADLLWMTAFFVAYRIFQDYVLSPYVMSEGIELHPALVIVGILAGEEIGGIAGMFLAIPVLAAGKIILERTRPAPAATPALLGEAGVTSDRQHRAEPPR
jgi:predicted PurR-regulated permease PerM